jgi:hypothetical protein
MDWTSGLSSKGLPKSLRPCFRRVWGRSRVHDRRVQFPQEPDEEVETRFLERTRRLVCSGGCLLASPACAAGPTVPAALQSKQNGSSSTESVLKKDDLVYADRVAWRSRLNWPPDCESTFDYPDKSFAGGCLASCPWPGPAGFTSGLRRRRG